MIIVALSIIIVEKSAQMTDQDVLFFDDFLVHDEGSDGSSVWGDQTLWDPNCDLSRSDIGLFGLL